MSTEKNKGGKRKLGKGLSALLGDDEEDYAELDRVRLTKTVPIEFVHPGAFQPRRVFDEAEIEGLVESVRKRGILQPILVRRHPDKPMAYEIIAGERRWRAAQKAELHEISVIIKDLSDGEALEIALVENLQRQDLNPLEEAEGYQRLIDEFSNTQEDLAKTVGKSRSHVANMLRLLNLPDSVKTLVDAGKLSAGHARALVGAEKSEALAKQVVKKGLNVRQTEALVQAGGKKARPRKDKAEETGKDTDTLAVEREMTALLGLAVSITFQEGKGGRLVIRYQSLEQLEDILERLSHKAESEEGVPPAPETDVAMDEITEDADPDSADPDSADSVPTEPEAGEAENANPENAGAETAAEMESSEEPSPEDMPAEEAHIQEPAEEVSEESSGESPGESPGESGEEAPKGSTEEITEEITEETTEEITEESPNVNSSGEEAPETN